jgi:hypothetical protein
MTTEQFTQIATERISVIATNELMTEIKKLTLDHSDAANMVWDVAMNILMERISETEYIDFCNSL